MPVFRGKPPTGNLPAPLSSFIVREHEIKEIRQLLSANRLVTLTGPGGCGQTRLALEVAYELIGEFEHRIWFEEPFAAHWAEGKAILLKELAVLVHAGEPRS